MDITQVKGGRFSEKELVELFGSEAQKKSYAENGRFVGNYKNNIFKKINRYCKVEECGKEDGRQIYEIVDVYEHPIPTNFNKMNKSIYKYIVPLILSNLVNGHDENNKIDITVGKWARNINMVNRNYNLCKYKPKQTADMLCYTQTVVNEFYEKADDMIEWYISNALDYLKSAGLIIWRESHRIGVEKSSGKTVIDEKGNIQVDINIDNHHASDEEMEFYSKCVEIADEEAGIENASERYYSHKADVFRQALNRELYKRKIKYVYKTYQAYYVHLDRCEYLLKQFDIADEHTLIENFNREFTDMIIKNAKKRYDRRPDKYQLSKDRYSSRYQNLCEITINNKTEYLGERIREKTIDDNYKLTIKTHMEESASGI